MFLLFIHWVKTQSYQDVAPMELKKLCAPLYYNPSFSCLSRRSLKGEGGFMVDYF